MRPRDPAAEFLRAFGRAARDLRKAQDLSQEDAAFRAGLDRTYLSGVERGVRNPTLKTMFRIAAALGVKLGRLVDEAQGAPEPPRGRSST